MTQAGRGRVARAQLDMCRDAWIDSSVRRIVIGYLLFNIAEVTSWLGALVYAFDRGGAGAVGVVGAALLVPGALFAPLASYAGDRFHRVRVVMVGYAVIGACCALSAAAIGTELPAVIVYVAAAAVSTAMVVPRPAIGALLPCTVRSGDQLTAANVTMGVARSLAVTLGPALGAVLLTVGGPMLLFAVSGIAVVPGIVLLIGLEPQRATLTAAERMSVGDVHVETMAGLSMLRSERVPRLVLLMLGVQAAMLCFLDVGAVVVALDVLARPEQFSGWLGVATGTGSVVGSIGAVTLVGRRRIAPTFLTATLLAGTPLAVLAVAANATTAMAAFMVCGVGLALSEIAGETLLQRVTPDELMARVYGCVEGFRMGAFAIGSVACSLLFANVEIDGVVMIVAGCAVAAVALAARPLLAVDRDRLPPEPELLETLRSVHFLAPLPAAALERVCSSAVRLTPRPGEHLVRHGDAGSSMFVIAAGEAIVARHGFELARLRQHDHFGELALVDDAPRNADVRAGEGLVVYELPRRAFLLATTGHPRAEQRLSAFAAARRASAERVAVPDATAGPIGDEPGVAQRSPLAEHQPGDLDPRSLPDLAVDRVDVGLDGAT